MAINVKESDTIKIVLPPRIAVKQILGMKRKRIRTLFARVVETINSWEHVNACQGEDSGARVAKALKSPAKIASMAAKGSSSATLFPPT